MAQVGPGYTITTFPAHSMTRRPSSPKAPAASGFTSSVPPQPGETGVEPRVETLRALVDNLDEAVVAVARNGQVQFANAAAERLYGIAPQGPALAGWSEAYGIYLPDRRTLWPAEELPGALALKGQTVETEQYIQPPGASEGYWIAMRARPMFDSHGKVQGALLAWRDVTEERQTAEGRRRLLAIVENTPDFVGLTDASLRTIFINRAGRELLGIGEREEVQEYPIYESSFEGQREIFESEVLPALLRGDPWIGEFRLRHAKTGRSIAVDMRAFGIFGAYGQLIGVANVSRDITARREAEETRQRLASIVEYSHDAIISESLEGVITTWNRGAELIFGYVAEEAVGQPITMLAWPGYEDDMRELLRRIRAEEVVEHYETLRRHKDGRCLAVSLTLSPVRDDGGKLIGISKIARDITQQREREDLSRRQAQLLDQAYEPILVRDHEDRIVYWNKGAERLYGWTATEAKGRLSHDLLHTAFSQPMEEISATLERQGHWEGELIHETRSGHRLMVLSRWIRELGVAESHVLETNVDVSERQQRIALEEQARLERRFRQLLEAAPDAIVEVSADGNVVLVNRVAEEMFGYPRDELIGQSVDLLVPDTVRQHHRGYRNAYLEHPRTRPMGTGLELHGRRRNGSLFPVEISLSPIQTEGGVHVTAVIRDVTERKRAEQEVRRLQLQYTGELEARNREIERANRLKSEFLASMSHELRTPLHTIIGFAELLEEGHEGALNQAQSRFLEHIRRDSEHLLELINDVLDLSKVEAGQLVLKREAYLLARSVGEALDAIRPGAAAKGITIEERGTRESLVDADPLRVKEMLYNLLSNAVKFTPEGGKVWVDTAEDGGFARITVGDTGIGIPVGEHENIFDKFYQVGNTTRGVREGTGLGLSITKELVQMHGGWMEVESTPGEGSLFIFRLPLVKAEL
ncbi:MAG: PAS domain S-box protein [Acidobacteriaceae bacterium]